ncbi:hypothetical protein SMC26_11875 [Actinomadura fulvescens]|uniref:Uncharacterized protein n=1 Tax=Actinomadura fulvescens TaxID=46160 RepID=A0ABN3PET3_9ACTN
MLALLWSADLTGKKLEWRYSTTIERVLIDKHVPPLAADVGNGYQITARHALWQQTARGAPT